jgi:hypothetical protein
MTYLSDVGPSKRPGPEADSSAPQGWSLGALAIGLTLVLASGVGHVIAWLYIELADTNMNSTDRVLGLAITIADVLVLLSLGVVANVAGMLGLRDAHRSGAGRGLATIGMWCAGAGLVCWLLASANLIIVAIAQLH